MSSTNFPHPFSAMASRYRAYRAKLPRVASGIAATDFRRNFRRQGVELSKGTTTKWKQRRGGSDKGRAILIKSGRLRRGIRSAPTYDHARVINAVPYAAIHNRGGQLKGNARVWASGLKSRQTRLRSNPGGARAMMPARPFMITTPGLMEEISGNILKGLQHVFNP